ncbi:MAG: glutamyl-tRNA reductase [Verrucomicrobia bacterium]|nr:glutamyl-tRNA reductase [Verrucomicrobiota bacterium]
MNSAPAVFSVVGCHHQRVDDSVRERFALTNEQAARIAVECAANPAFQESLVLNTCNRIEVYCVGADTEAIQNAVIQLIAHNCGEPADLVSANCYQRDNADAIRHLFEVAAGLDSQIVGETEIFGQVKSAYQNALQCKTSGRLLNKIFKKLFQCAKYVRSNTSIGIGHVSLGNVAVDLAQRIFGDLSACRLLVVGSGDVGRDVAIAFRNRGVKSLHISSRTEARASALASAIGGTTIPMNEWQNLLATVDIAIFATSAPGCLLMAPELKPKVTVRNGQPLFLIDLAVPRDVDEACSSLEDVYLYCMQDLASIANENLAARLEHIDQARFIISQKVAALSESVAR